MRSVNASVTTQNKPAARTATPANKYLTMRDESILLHFHCTHGRPGDWTHLALERITIREERICPDADHPPGGVLRVAYVFEPGAGPRGQRSAVRRGGQPAGPRPQLRARGDAGGRARRRDRHDRGSETGERGAGAGGGGADGSPPSEPRGGSVRTRGADAGKCGAGYLAPARAAVCRHPGPAEADPAVRN